MPPPESSKDLGNMKISGILAIFCDFVPLMIIICIYGGAAFILLFDETSPLLTILNELYSNLYPFVLVGGSLLMILTVFFVVRSFTLHQPIRPVVVYGALVFLIINALFNLASYFISEIYASIRLLIYWPPFGMLMEWNELILNPVLLSWVVINTIITIGTIILFGYLLLTLNKYIGSTSLKILAIFFLVQIVIYISQIIFSLNLPAYIHQQIIFWIFLCGFLISCLFIFAGFSLNRKPNLINTARSKTGHHECLRGPLFKTKV